LGKRFVFHWFSCECHWNINLCNNII